MNIGITEPKYAILSNGTPVVVKLFNGVEGNLILFNEYICYRLALLVDLPMPHSGICEMDSNTSISAPDIANEVNYGFAFYSTYLNKATKLVPSIINLMKNKEDFIKILLFDHIIFNSDRNDGNLLVSYYKNNITLKVIDHSHVFVNGPFWNLSNCLRYAMDERDILSTKIMEHNASLYSMFFANMSITQSVLEQGTSIFKSKFKCGIIRELVKDIPLEWCPSQDAIDLLESYIMYRVDNLDTIISTILNYKK